MGKKNGSLLPAALDSCLAASAAFLYHEQRNTEEDCVKIPARRRNPEKELVRRMADLIHYDRFQLVVQPVIDLQTRAIVGGEVLSRLSHPEQGMISPDRFLPAVEAAQLHPQFDYYMFRKACGLMKRLTDRGVQIGYLSCNFSRKTLSLKGVAARLSKIAAEFGVPHEVMAVEITEREQETDIDEFCENLIDIRNAGFRIFADDLGAGVTTVKDMWSYPLDVVKIDRSLLLEMDTEQGRSVYRGLRNLAVDLGCMVLCEGVETEEQHRFVVDAGCHYCQGFLFYRPMEDEQFLCLMGAMR